jgi:hypothetical protein
MAGEPADESHGKLGWVAWPVHALMGLLFWLLDRLHIHKRT